MSNNFLYKFRIEDYDTVKQVLDQLEIPKSALVLNVGCGNSEFSEKMYDDGYVNNYSIDICENGINYIKKKNNNEKNLRNIDIATLERAGLDAAKIQGYTFKTGSKGGNTQKAEDSGIVCEKCGAPVSQKVASYSQSKFGKILCMECQKGATA